MDKTRQTQYLTKVIYNLIKRVLSINGKYRCLRDLKYFLNVMILGIEKVLVGIEHFR